MVKIFVLLISVPLMIAAIVCALFADRIDTVVKGDKKVKKVIIVFSVGVLLVCTIAILASILSQIS
ncbi:MAG: protein CrcB-like protein [Oscillospiraceae bacterium]|jgi:hypothetical protein|nr:protein CrcB-like protein [Oscillospiraceae bacterium]